MAKKEPSLDEKLTTARNGLRIAAQNPQLVGQTDLILDYPELVAQAHEAIEHLMEMRYVIRDAINMNRPARFAGSHFLTKEDVEQELKDYEV